MTGQQRIWAGIAMLCVAAAPGPALVLPTPAEAKVAVLAAFGDPQISALLKDSSVRLGTCKQTRKPAFPGEISCTVAIVAGAATNETQFNFHRAGGKWAASENTEDLPFPDPAL